MFLLPTLVFDDDFDAVPNTIHAVDTSNKPVIGTLPPNPDPGNIFVFIDAAGTSIAAPTGFGNGEFRLNTGLTAHTIQGAPFLFLEENQAIALLFYNNKYIPLALCR